MCRTNLSVLLAIGLLSGCAAEGPCATDTVCGRVVEGEDARLSKNSVSVEVTLFWHAFLPESPFHPIGAAFEGTLPLDFSIAISEPPPPEATFQIEDPELGVTVDESAPWVGSAQFYLTAPGALETNWEGVEAFDTDLVLGMSRDATLFYTPVDLETTAGIRDLAPRIDDQPIAAGYHLYIGRDEVDLTTPIEAELGYVAD